MADEAITGPATRIASMDGMPDGLLTAALQRVAGRADLKIPRDASPAVLIATWCTAPAVVRAHIAATTADEAVQELAAVDSSKRVRIALAHNDDLHAGPARTLHRRIAASGDVDQVKAVAAHMDPDVLVAAAAAMFSKGAKVENWFLREHAHAVLAVHALPDGPPVPPADLAVSLIRAMDVAADRWSYTDDVDVRWALLAMSGGRVDRHVAEWMVDNDWSDQKISMVRDVTVDAAEILLDHVRAVADRTKAPAEMFADTIVPALHTGGHTAAASAAYTAVVTMTPAILTGDLPHPFRPWMSDAANDPTVMQPAVAALRSRQRVDPSWVVATGDLPDVLWWRLLEQTQRPTLHRLASADISGMPDHRVDQLLAGWNAVVAYGSAERVSPSVAAALVRRLPAQTVLSSGMHRDISQAAADLIAARLADHDPASCGSFLDLLGQIGRSHPVTTVLDVHAQVV